MDVFRISQIASRNVEKEQEGEGDANGEYGSRRVGHRGTEARARTQAGDVALDNTDAEVRPLRGALILVKHSKLLSSGCPTRNSLVAAGSATKRAPRACMEVLFRLKPTPRQHPRNLRFFRLISPQLDFEERQESAAEDEEGGSSRANSQPEGEGRAQGLARSASSSGASMPASGMPAGGDGAGEQRLHTAPADTARSKDSAASVTAAGPAPARTDSAHLVRADSGGLAQAEAASTSGQRLASPAPSEARPSATPQLGSNPRHEKREPRGDMQGAESAAESAGVRGGIESMGARHGHVVLEDVVWHPSDMLVKPIVGNRRIERVPEPRWDSGEFGRE